MYCRAMAYLQFVLRAVTTQSQQSSALTPTPLPKGLEQLAQRERGAYSPNCKQLLAREHKPRLASIHSKPQKSTPSHCYIVKTA